MKKPNFTDSDYVKLAEVINKKKSYVLSDVKDKIEKVAFDVVRFKDDDLSHLWQVQKADDGTDIIVAMYEADESLISEGNEFSANHISNASLEKIWNAIPDTQANIHVFYKGEAIHKFASSKILPECSDLNLICRTLVSSLSFDNEFAKGFN